MISPRDEGELAEAIRAARGPLTIRGGGTRGMNGGGTDGGAVLSTAALVGIPLYEPEALTIVAAAGTPLAGIEAALAAEGQRLAFEPMDHRGVLGSAGEPTIGAVLAANISGPRRIQAGAARDAALGLRFVTGEGRAIQAGGRVMKNVTGYDLVRLLCGSHGRLGVISQVALKVLPVPEAAATLTVALDDPPRAVAALSAALGTPHEVSGAAFWPGRGALLRIEGFAASVRARAGALARKLEEFGPVTVEDDPHAVAALWHAVRDVQPLQGRAGDLWRFSVRPTDGPALAARLEPEALLMDWGGGLLWALLPAGTDPRGRLEGGPLIKGHAALVRADGPHAQARAAGPAGFGPLPCALGPPQPAIAALEAGLRARFDPRGLFSGPQEGAA